MIFTFEPILKPTPWGGTRIREIKGLPPDPTPIGESWELSAVEGMESVVDAGPDRGLTLRRLMAKYGAGLVGQRVLDRYAGEFPLLIKFLDSSQWLSLQVHPDDRIVRKLESATQGKTEMWHVIDCQPGAQLIAGFKPGVTVGDYLKAEGSRELLGLVQHHDVSPGQDFYIAPGIIHALGPGCFVAEVQQSCDFTYRVYDYDRPRELHFDKARRSLKFNVGRSVADPVDCFKVETLTAFRPMELRQAPESFQIIMVVQGSLTLDGVQAPMGSTMLISADHGPAHLVPSTPSATILKIKV